MKAGSEESWLWDQLTRACDARSDQDSVLLSVIGTFWAANAVLLVALFVTGRPPESPTVGIIVSSAGVLLSLVWHGIQGRALGHVIRFETLTKEIEKELEIDDKWSLHAGGYTEPTGTAWPRWIAGTLGWGAKGARRHLTVFPSARFLMESCTVVVATFWTVALIVFVTIRAAM